MTSKLNWRISQVADVCFWQDDRQVKCWQQRKQVKELVKIKLQRESTFELRVGEQVLKQQKVNINYTETKYRRKLRSHWSIF